MTESMKKFLEVLSADQQLLDSASKMEKSQLIALGKEKGLTLSDADFQPDNELDDAELETVAGGKACYCVAGGGGVRGGNDNMCVCVLAGEGHQHDNIYITRCSCPVIGHGQSTNEE